MTAHIRFIPVAEINDPLTLSVPALERLTPRFLWRAALPRA
jgi:hypothetical protein